MQEVLLWLYRLTTNSMMASGTLYPFIWMVQRKCQKSLIHFCWWKCVRHFNQGIQWIYVSLTQMSLPPFFLLYFTIRNWFVLSWAISKQPVMSIHIQILLTMAVSIPEDALSILTKLGQYMQFVWLCVYYKCWPKFVQTDNASSSIKTADCAFRASVIVLVCMIPRFLLFPMLYSAQCLLVKSGSVMPVFLSVWITVGFL